MESKAISKSWSDRVTLSKDSGVHTPVNLYIIKSLNFGIIFKDKNHKLSLGCPGVLIYRSFTFYNYIVRSEFYDRSRLRRVEKHKHLQIHLVLICWIQLWLTVQRQMLSDVTNGSTYYDNFINANPINHLVTFDNLFAMSESDDKL